MVSLNERKSSFGTHLSTNWPHPERSSSPSCAHQYSPTAKQQGKNPFEVVAQLLCLRRQAKDSRPCATHPGNATGLLTGSTDSDRCSRNHLCPVCGRSRSPCLRSPLNTVNNDRKFMYCPNSRNKLPQRTLNPSAFSDG